jgi:hypothetical protein
MPVQCTCPTCGTTFFRVPSKVLPGSRCSNSCSMRQPILLSEFSDDGMTAKIPLCAKDGSIRAYALVDAADEQWVSQWRWHLNAQGYAARQMPISKSAKQRRQSIRLHRALLGLTPGDGLEGDHKDLDRLNCRRSNLRIVTKTGNRQNRDALRGSTSTHRGVSWDSRARKWIAQVSIGGKNRVLGRFSDELEAAEIAKTARVRFMPAALT